jgi:SAM-dependent methyltransferase
MKSRWLYAFTIFVSAFLLFQVQPIIARMILPWFGGTSAVWTTCMLFFQMALLLGYLYAHWLHEQPARRQAAIHSVLLLVSLAVLPIMPSAAWKPAGAARDPLLLILGLLTVTIGLPYFILSTSSPLLQAWYARQAGSVPYRLFALSNLASMLALLTYPVLIEPNLAVKTQSYVWSTAYLLFAVSCALTAWLSARSENKAAAPAPERAPAPAWPLRLLWTALAACASTLLLAVTTFITQDIAAIPFLWILPLSVYLLSFILCFESSRLYRREWYLPAFVAALACFAYYLWPGSARSHMPLTIGLITLSLFACCMVCHGELARLRPHPSRLTGFYLGVSVGGALGGLFVGLAAPNLFNAYYEFPIGASVCAALVALILIRQGLRPLTRAFLATAAIAYMILLGVMTRQTVAGYRVVTRNFYGELRVVDEGTDDDEDADRKLLHGRINHGIQMRDPQYRRTPVAYFCPPSGIGHVMASRPAGTPWRVGILGLGAGALAPYGQPGDTFRIYEINPQVLELAQSQFTYLKDTPAKIEVALGDGRLVLENEPTRQFDLLVMDAFSGDSVPVHLITREAFASYFRHLKPGGVLVLNISNRYLDLEPVMERAAHYFGRTCLIFDYTAKDDDEFFCSSSSWAVLVNPGQPLPESLKSGRVLQPRPGFRIWTDDFSNMFSILR